MGAFSLIVVINLLNRLNQIMTYCLPPNLLALFTPRDPVAYLPPNSKLPHEKTRTHQGGIAQFVQLFEDTETPQEKVKVETKEERKARQAGEKAKLNDVRIREYLDAGLYDPNELQGATTDSFKTLFIARLNFDTSESKLRREFEHYGPIRKIRIVSDLNGKPRGYAFIEYEHERDMRSAYKHADGKKIDGRRVLVDVERARTVEGWLPRRLGGGLGNTRRSLLPKWKRELGIEEGERRRSESRSRRSPEGGSRRRRSRSRDRGHKRDKERAGDGEGESSSRKKSRSRERKRKRSRSKDREGGKEAKEAKESKRKRSKSREKKRKRSRERDGKDKEHKSSSSHGGEKGGMNGSANGPESTSPPSNHHDIPVKQEPNSEQGYSNGHNQP